MSARPGRIEVASSRRSTLRAATDAAHRSLDQTAGSFDLGSIDHYRAFLEASASALLPLEALLTVSNVVEHCPDWPSRARSHLLMQDIEWVHGRARPMMLERLPLNSSEVFGMLYVLEGSRLGARLLLKQVSCRSQATRYLAANDPSLWRTFLHNLEATPALTDMAQACDCARYTFSVFAHAFSEARWS